MLKFKNIPNYAYDYKYMVFCRDKKDKFTLCFWGAWDDERDADEVAFIIGGETWGTDIIVKT